MSELEDHWLDGALGLTLPPVTGRCADVMPLKGVVTIRDVMHAYAVRQGAKKTRPVSRTGGVACDWTGV